MLMTVAELRQHIETDESDQILESKLKALELMIRAYTNNNFQHRGYRAMADITDGVLITEGTQPFRVGDTVQISTSSRNDGLYTVTAADDYTATVAEETSNEIAVVVTKVVYPMDVKMGVVNLMKWEQTNRDKVGVASESISRHSVTYFNMDEGNSIMGYPASLMGFLRPYHKARFGKGLTV